MINKVILVGRITKDPELRFINGDVPLVRFILAVNRNFNNKSGEREADFINCTVWNKQAENLAKYITKGSMLGVEGSIRINVSENNNQKQFFTEVRCDSIQFLEPKKNNSDSEVSNNNSNFQKEDNYNQNTNENQDNKTLFIDDENVPF
ncbi:single-stranded DNA-binding protein [Candidatus Phytoplasma ziziphi]|uniref:Single-stranded DNA-binding protein n=1 Tax=Ziziphus jujuba witches'-broom phytoplasma TaxID=135727 RepID=A0A660HMQ0_ZIZJU|nr:single-stranded DNA-binding protein [Candidatus Phytoplasma ziziphi]AYJ01262.1 single-stranded DNA-binding protein [Candidatus Phytoplasma ziziphi]